jgi:hypothetical protein
VNAIFGCLLAVGGSLLFLQDLVSRDYRSLWLSVLLAAVGSFMLLRHRPDDDVIDLREEAAGTCATCRGAGTVYSDEWNDWRRSGPIQNIRELCPSCQGMHTPLKSTTAGQQPDPRA